MPLKAGLVQEAFHADGTAKHPLGVLGVFVAVPGGLVPELPGAVAAREGLLGLEAHVGVLVEGRPGPEGRAAVGAGVGLSGVHVGHVLVAQVGAAEHLGAVRAHHGALVVVRLPHVAVQVGRAVVRLAAHMAPQVLPRR